MLQVVSVQFHELTLEKTSARRIEEEHNNGCSDADKVTLFDGSSSRSTPIGSYCKSSTDLVSPISTSGSSLLVVFQSNGINDIGRFSLDWKFVGYGQGWLNQQLINIC